MKLYSIPLAVLAVLAFGCASASVNPDAGPDGDAAADDGGGSDAANSCSKSPCDIYEQCGCAPPQVCDIDLEGLPTGETACRDVIAPGTEQATCAGLTSCAAGYVCLAGQCRAYCEDDPECGEDAFCNLRPTYTDSGGNSQQVPGIITCSKKCTPEATINNNCPDGYGCGVFTADRGMPTEFTHTDCYRGGAGGNGVDCAANGLADCRAGYTCVIFSVSGAETGRECRQNCRVVGGSCETGGQACAGFGTPALLNGVEYGFCNN